MQHGTEAQNAAEAELAEAVGAASPQTSALLRRMAELEAALEAARADAGSYQARQRAEAAERWAAAAQVSCQTDVRHHVCERWFDNARHGQQRDADLVHMEGLSKQWMQ